MRRRGRPAEFAPCHHPVLTLACPKSGSLNFRQRHKIDGKKSCVRKNRSSQLPTAASSPLRASCAKAKAQQANLLLLLLRRLRLLNERSRRHKPQWPPRSCRLTWKNRKTWTVQTPFLSPPRSKRAAEQGIPGLGQPAGRHGAQGESRPTGPTAMNFERLVQSFYMTAAVQMGAGTAPNEQPRIDILGARQSIDMLTVLEEKTKGNLNEQEKRLLQNALFDLRMSFLEITNAIANSAQRPPQAKKPH